MKAAAKRTNCEALSGFIARGLASRSAAQVSGRYVTASTVPSKLEARLKNAREKAAIAK